MDNSFKDLRVSGGAGAGARLLFIHSLNCAHSLAHTLSHSHTLTLSHSHTLTHTFSHTHSLTHSLTLTLSLTPSTALSPTQVDNSFRDLRVSGGAGAGARLLFEYTDPSTGRYTSQGPLWRIRERSWSHFVGFYRLKLTTFKNRLLIPGK